MRLKAILAIVAIVALLLLEFLPPAQAIIVYAIVGATLGAFFRKVNNWARDGMAGVVGGMVLAVIADQVLPSIIDSSVEGMDGLSVFIFRSIPYVLKAGLIWATIVSVIQKVHPSWQ